MRFDTLAQHGGYDPKEHRGHRSEPIYPDTAPVQPDCETAREVFAGRKEGVPVYLRFGNDNASIAERRISLLEGGEATKCFATGLAAIYCLILALTKKGDTIVSQRKIYGGTYSMFTNDLIDAGRNIIFIDDMNDVNRLNAAATARPKAVFTEILSNPTLEVLDIEPIAEFSKTNHIPLIVDNTFATPVLFRPLEYGADAIVHSTTKYMNPGGTNTGGSATGSKELIALVSERSKTFGAPLAPFDAWLTTLGLRTLSLRVKHQSESALKIARFLEKHPRIKRAYYPHLMNSRNYFLAKKYLPEGAGAVVAVELDGNKTDAIRFVESLKIFSIGVNLGPTSSLAIIPADTTHSTLTLEDLTKAGISETFIRFSVGLEDPEDILEDIEQALRGI